MSNYGLTGKTLALLTEAALAAAIIVVASAVVYAERLYRRWKT